MIALSLQQIGHVHCRHPTKNCDVEPIMMRSNQMKLQKTEYLVNDMNLHVKILMGKDATHHHHLRGVCDALPISTFSSAQNIIVGGKKTNNHCDSN